MRILLFVTSIYNTFTDLTKDTFEQIIDKLEEIADIEQDQLILFSFCDETTNKNLIFSFYRIVSECMKEKKITFSRQFLGDVYYSNLPNGGAILYKEPFNKAKQVYNYVKSLENDDNYINLYYVDSNMNIDEINEIFENEKNVDIKIINEATNTKEIIFSLNKLINKIKLLEYK